MTVYSRTNPSPRYTALLELYKSMHAEGFERNEDGVVANVRAEEAYPGQQLLSHIGRIRELINKHGAATVLDYGCGKGAQYRTVQLRDQNGKTGTVQQYWGVSEIRLYDPGVPSFSRLPKAASDGVVCTDVLEHIPEADLPWVVGELYSLSRKFVYAAIACYPARAILPSGDNAHETVQSPDWWQELFTRVGRDYPGIVAVLECETGT
ncbi:class I SAM-dependent methyltransferase [uncultured Nisaea sp.]|uniref:class I SAM-dependent methyltransferase n=1 Tax=uncultured Nisaea sp. TaxID=538215 RepID=UPI0030EEE8CF|tara:strand:+ start:6370 stop:6993 length:624 start_codon:yes stop_codon:yes gene_type:complete